MKEYKMRISLTFDTPILGSSPSNPQLYDDFIASKAPVTANIDEELEEIGRADAADKTMTVFPRGDDGVPMFRDYQIKGFFKAACQALRKVSDTKSSKIKAFKKEIDTLIFIDEKRIPIAFDGEITSLQRPLRASTPQGERVSLSCSEMIPESATCEFTIKTLLKSHIPLIKEWLDYGRYSGLGQWRNAGYGQFTWKLIKEWEEDC